jgi:hypothetical protein
MEQDSASSLTQSRSGLMYLRIWKKKRQINQTSLLGPPQWIDNLLECFCAPHLLEEVQGDLHERYFLRVQKVGKTKAGKQYLWEVMVYLRPSVIKRNSYDYSSTSFFSWNMLHHYFKTAYRNLLKNKGYSLINIGGLTVGMAVAMLIGLWVYDELSFNTYHQNYDRIGQVMKRDSSNQKQLGRWKFAISTGNRTPKQLPESFQAYCKILLDSELYPY